MELETSIARDIGFTSEDTQCDVFCKRLLSRKIILAWLLKYCLDEFKEYPISEIAEIYIEGEPEISSIPVLPDETNAAGKIHGMATEDASKTEGTIVYDIRFIAILPASGERIRLLINVEAQARYHSGYPLIKRAIYYCCRMISSQYEVEFADSHYEDIRKVCSI